METQAGVGPVEWQESQDLDGLVADAALRDLVQWRAEYAIKLRNHVHHLGSVIRTAGELLFDGAIRPPHDSLEQH
jgi:hypothetical protein